MESSTSKAEAMKPLFLKAGVPLVLSVAAFVHARIITRRGFMAKASSLETKANAAENMESHEELRDEATFNGLDSTSSPLKYDDKEEIIESSRHLCSKPSSDSVSKVIFEEEMSNLGSRIEELQKTEWELEKKFLCYQAMKDQEFLLMELSNRLLLDSIRVEFLDKEVSSMEAENQRCEKLVVGHLRVLQQLEYVKQENELLQRKVKKLSRKKKEQSQVIAEKTENIEASEAEILRCYNELDARNDVIMKLEEKVEEFQHFVNQLQQEKNELLIEVNSAEKAAPSISQIETEDITVENYKKLVNELQQLQKNRATETAEVIYLRWTNACLRHELMRSHVQLQQIEDKKNRLELEHEGNVEIGEYGLDHQHHDDSVMEHGGHFLDVTTASQACPKGKKLLQKLKKWVEGSDNLNSKLGEKEKRESNCFRRHSASEYAEEAHLIHARRSTSSA